MQQDQSLERVNEVKNRYEDQLLQLPGVVGVAVSAGGGQETEAGRYVIKVLVSHGKNQGGGSGESPIPESLEGVPVEVEETGEFHAY